MWTMFIKESILSTNHFLGGFCRDNYYSSCSLELGSETLSLVKGLILTSEVFSVGSIEGISVSLTVSDFNCTGRL